MTASSSEARNGDDVFAGLGAGAQQHVQRGVTAIVEDHVRAVVELEGLVEIVPMLLQASDP
jgi:hypothetical protein